MYLKASYYKYPPDDFFITKKKVKFISIHFDTVISKPQCKSFCHTLNYHLLQMECYYLHNLVDIWLKLKEIKDIKN